MSFASQTQTPSSPLFPATPVPLLGKGKRQRSFRDPGVIVEKLNRLKTTTSSGDINTSRKRDVN